MRREREEGRRGKERREGKEERRLEREGGARGKEEGRRAISCTYTCGSPEWKSNIPLHNSTTLPYLKHCNAKLPLRAGLIRAAKMHEYLMSLCSMCEPHP